MTDMILDQAELERRAKHAKVTVVTVEMIEKWQRDHPKCWQARNCFTMGCYYASPNKCRRTGP